MHWIDLSIVVVYFAAMLFIGFWFHRKNNNTEDYFVGSREMTKWHLGLSVVATDVGGGFSIGLGGLGFVMGLSGSWILFTGLLGAWLTAVVLIPKVHRRGVANKMQTFPEILQHSYGKTVALAAALISAIGYMGFTASQVLAGAKLTSATFVGVDIPQAVIIMGAIAVIYTALGGIKAVIYTDTVQWIILLSGLSLVGVPFALKALGGWEAAKVFLNAEMLQMTNLSVSTLINWAFSIIPIWFIGMTLYQRIFAAKSGKEAQRAWFIAGLFNYKKSKNALKVVQWMTLVIGVLAIVIALYIPSVLELMLLSYGFMVSGLMAPVLGFLIYKKPSRNAAIASMISGSLSLLVIQVGKLPLPWELDAVVPALSISLLTLFVMQAYYSNASPDAQST